MNTVSGLTFDDGSNGAAASIAETTLCFGVWTKRRNESSINFQVSIMQGLPHLWTSQQCAQYSQAFCWMEGLAGACVCVAGALYVPAALLMLLSACGAPLQADVSDNSLTHGRPRDHPTHRQPKPLPQWNIGTGTTDNQGVLVWEPQLAATQQWPPLPPMPRCRTATSICTTAHLTSLSIMVSK